jgi:hypothetical protein
MQVIMSGRKRCLKHTSAIIAQKDSQRIINPHLTGSTTLNRIRERIALLLVSFATNTAQGEIHKSQDSEFSFDNTREKEVYQ